MAVGHVRYSTTGSSRPQNIQPLLVESSTGSVAVAHNGNLVNAKRLRDEHEALGSIFSDVDRQRSAACISCHALKISSGPDHIQHCLRQLKGAYSLVIMTRDKLIGARDPQGFRPLIFGADDDA